MPETNGTVLAHVRVSSAGNTSIFEVRRSPAYIGTDASCDVNLRAEGQGAIDPRHAQLLRLTDGRFRLVNLSQQPIALRDPAPAVLHARSIVDLASGSRFDIGPYAIQLLSSMEQVTDRLLMTSNAHGAKPRRRKSQFIGLQLTPQGTTSLAAGQTLPITVSIKNEGDAERVKFEVEVIGVDAEFCEANDGPVLGPKEDGEILVAIKQPAELKSNKLSAGDLDIGVRVTAVPYANQPVEDFVTIQVLPVYLPYIEEAAG